jgi:hypothetical protein
MREVWTSYRLKCCRGFDAGQARGVGDGGAQISRLEVGVIRQNLLPCHVAAQQIQKEVNRVTQAADARLAVADIRVHRDAPKQLFVRHNAKLHQLFFVASAHFGRTEADQKTSEAVIQKVFDELPAP